MGDSARTGEPTPYAAPTSTRTVTPGNSTLGIAAAGVRSTLQFTPTAFALIHNATKGDNP